MLIISHRNKLVKKYKEWLKYIPEAANQPINMVSFLSMNGLLNEDKVKEFIK